MARLTKAKIADIALAESNRLFNEKITSAKEALGSEMKKLIPRQSDEIERLYKDNPKLFYTSTWIGLRHDSTRRYYSIAVDPYVSEFGGQVEIDNNHKEHEKIVGLHDEYKELLQDKKDFESKLIVTLSTMGTDKKLLEFLPELANRYSGIIGGAVTSNLPMAITEINAIRELTKC